MVIEEGSCLEKRKWLLKWGRGRGTGVGKKKEEFMGMDDGGDEITAIGSM